LKLKLTKSLKDKKLIARNKAKKEQIVPASISSSRYQLLKKFK